MTAARKLNATTPETIDQNLVNTVRIERVAAPTKVVFEEDADLHLKIHTRRSRIRTVTSKLSAYLPSPELDGIAKLCQRDMFIALLFLTVLNAAVFVYYHVFSPTSYMSKESAIVELEGFFPSQTLETDTVLDAASNGGNGNMRLLPISPNR